MSSLQPLKEFIKERLSAAAEEICRHFEETIGRYEAELDRQRRLLDSTQRPQILIHNIVLPQQVPRGADDLRPWERNFCVEPQEPEPRHVEEPREKIGTSLDEGKDVVKQETEALMVTPAHEENGEVSALPQHLTVGDGNVCDPKKIWNLNLKDEPEPPQDQEEQGGVCPSRGTKHLDVKQETNTSVVTAAREEEETDANDLQVPGGKFNAAVCQDREENQPGGSAASTEEHRRKDAGGQGSDGRHHEQVLWDSAALGRKSRSDSDSSEFRELKTNVKSIKYFSKITADDLTRHGDVADAIKKNHSQKTSPRDERGGVWQPNREPLRRSKTHTGKRNSCEECGRCFSQRSALTRHMKTHTGEKPFSCQVCGKCFRERENFRIHLRTHTGEKPFACDVCGKCFSQRPSLSVHLKTHTGQRDFSCEECGKRYPRKSHLDVHLRTHTGEKPFSCEVCYRRFNERQNLLRHARTHTGERPYSCEKCGKRFNQKKNLTVHVRTHTGEKPFSCEKCGCCFRQKQNLMVHLRTHTGEKPFPCEKCGKRYSQKSQLIVHLYSHGEDTIIRDAPAQQVQT